MNRVLIDFSPFLVRSALVCDGRLTEFIIDNEDSRSLTGNIYAARVKDVIKNQFAFCDIGENISGFLQFGDFRQRGLESTPAHSGKQVLVQVVRDAVDDKGPYLSCELSFSGKYSVLVKNMDNSSSVKVSRKIEDAAIKASLLETGRNLCPEGHSLIIRTEATCATQNQLETEIKRLHATSEGVGQKACYTKAPAKLWGDERIYSKTLMDLLDTNPDEIIINSEDEMEYIRHFACEYGNLPAENIKLHTGELPVFETFSVEAQTEKALNSKIWLKSGGFLLIEQAQTCTFIDVNTGKAVGKKNFEDTAHLVNMEAACEIAAQIRLKNISGFIIIDFINTKAEENDAALKNYFTCQLKYDRIPAIIADWSSLNTVQLTRKKTRPPLMHRLTDTCPCCKGCGKVKNVSFTADKAYKEIVRILSGGFYDKIEFEASAKLVEMFENTGSLKELESKYNCSISLVKASNFIDTRYNISKFKKGD